MNMFIGNTKIIVLFSCLLSSMLFAWESQTGQTIAAYNNTISQISHSVDSYDRHAITFTCEKHPICMYTPLSYEESQPKSLTKSYSLPGLKYTDLQLRYMQDDLRESCKLLGIDLKIDKIKRLQYGTGLNSGLRMIFTMQSDEAYDIIKVVDSDTKTVKFDIVAKI